MMGVGGQIKTRGDGEENRDRMVATNLRDDLTDSLGCRVAGAKQKRLIVRSY